MGKRDKSQVINNIDQLNLEIDYDKLAIAIVKAQKKTSVENEKSAAKTTRFRNALFGNVNGFIYYAVSFFMAVCIFSTWVSYANGTVNSLSLSIVFTILFAFLGFVSFMSGIETRKDNYEQTVALFNTNVSLIALIIAIIALIKGIA